MDAKDKRYTYDRFGMKGARVGQAVVDILSKDRPEITVGEILDEYKEDFVNQFECSVEDGAKRYTSPFYIFVLTGKEMWATNMVRNWFIPRQTAPHCSDMMAEHPNKSKTLYKIDYENGKAELLWTVPGINDCLSILSHPDLYDPSLVRWIHECFSGDLDKDDY